MGACLQQYMYSTILYSGEKENFVSSAINFGVEGIIQYYK